MSSELPTDGQPSAAAEPTWTAGEMVEVWQRTAAARDELAGHIDDEVRPILDQLGVYVRDELKARNGLALVVESREEITRRGLHQAVDRDLVGRRRDAKTRVGRHGVGVLGVAAGRRPTIRVSGTTNR